MENPRLTFATPTVIAGDKSLVALVAHELAHSWSGNLVTNATWRDFWLNEGFTVYFEERIVERVYGRPRQQMEAVLSRGELEKELQQLEPRDQVLHINLKGRDPDAGFTNVPYIKGALFLKRLEELYGRERFDAFLKQYFSHFAFQSITTGQFVAYLKQHLLQDGRVPDEIPAGEIPVHSWITHQTLRFLRALPEKLPASRMAELDRAFGFTRTGNSEILNQWLLMSIANQYAPAYPRLEQFLTSVGRRKFLKPLYEELVKTPEGSRRAERIYRKARPGYHPIAQAVIDKILRP
jgi:hypothetical protein